METPNLNYIKELSGGDLEFEENIIELLKKEFPEEHMLFNENFSKKEYVEAANNVHKIKHKISILGLKKGLELASRFEKDLKNTNTELYNDFVNILDKIHVYLKV
ncbi:Hpt domain-containing protein [Polaribacter sp. Z014]|uniref:Hpt domain-containing protein n=1 Tax=unclassified Polaribacter TaxID=196858 RepID=UPI00193BEB8A|nr:MULTISPECIES: Hpt domain-containing protein [unclassified Polaribacter]MCL7764147.1 Hpt domain-containing protein [Polaribacter sp. Z014]QVY65241.1 Hpt domain-containing protein [Polaribacter sp. Q13]